MQKVTYSVVSSGKSTKISSGWTDSLDEAVESYVKMVGYKKDGVSLYNDTQHTVIVKHTSIQEDSCEDIIPTPEMIEKAELSIKQKEQDRILRIPKKKKFDFLEFLKEYFK